MIEQLALVTDFGPGGPYLGQMKLCLSRLVPGLPVIDLVSDLVPFRPDLAAYLLPPLARDMPARTLYLCIVDPGVGGDRPVLAVEADGDWYVGPDNGLLALVARRAIQVQVLRVDWRPDVLSASFHGRDLFAPIAAMLHDGKIPKYAEIKPSQMLGNDWLDDLPSIIYADPYGNLMTGLQATALERGAIVHVGFRELANARTFIDVPVGVPFWYENSFGLVELAVNQGNARHTLKLKPGDRIDLTGSGKPV